MAVNYKQIWDDVKANNAKLDACTRHLFACDPPYRLGGKVVCANCRGRISLTDARQYVLGYKAAGGNPNDVWPGWD